MSQRDYYEILGVARDAEAEAIKAAFRKKASAFHPDRHPEASDKERKDLEEKFKEAAEAYEILSDPQKRAAYDRYGHAGVQGGGRREYSDFADIFGDLFEGFFGGMGGRPRAQRGGDLQEDVSLTFEEAAFGKEVELEVEGDRACETCHGSGAKPGSKTKTCPQCRGLGQVRYSQGFFSVATACNRCGGSGTLVDQPCAACGGQGKTRQTRKVKVQIPGGIDDDNQMRVRGEGEAGQPGAPPGDLYVTIRVKPHPLFQRDGNLVVCRLPLTMTQAALGCEIEVPTLDGNMKVRIPPGTQTGEEIVLRKKGIPSLRGGARGDQVLKVMVEIPVKMTSRQKELLEEFAALAKEDSHPQASGFFERARKLFS